LATVGKKFHAGSVASVTSRYHFETIISAKVACLRTLDINRKFHYIGV